jgi:ribonuclease T1
MRCGPARAVLLAILIAFLSGTAKGYPSIADVRLTDLPREARATVELIQQGGPFPYRKDGVTFGNRERLLPQARHGYYREYTVFTPGSRDRGARRIVTGSNGELYYTDDHYRSFRRILE